MARTIRKTLRGRSNFVSDIYIKGMLYGATVRCPFPHARIMSIDSSGLPDGVTLVTAADIPGPNSLQIADESIPILASGICSYSGEPVALIAGTSQQEVVAAEQALVIDYEELPAHFDFPSRESNQIVWSATGVRGKPDTELASSEQVVQGSYETGVQEHLYNEPQGAVADLDADGRVSVSCATQWPFHVRSTVAANLDIRDKNCVVSVTDTGVDLDGKLWYPSLVATHAALLANKSGAPVKLVYSNLEDFQFTSKRSPVRITHLTGLDKDGGLLASKVQIVYGCGAYPLFTREMTERMAASALGLYECANVSVLVEVHRTNLPPMNILSGFGSSSSHFAMETHMSRIVELVHGDPVEVRLDGIQKGDKGPYRVDGAAIRTAVVEAARQSDFSRKAAAFELQKKRRANAGFDAEVSRGIGIAVAAEGTGFCGSNEKHYPSAITVELRGDGSAVLRTSTVPRSESLRNYWIGLVAEGLGLATEAVQIVTGRTDTVPDSGPSTLSRSILNSSRLISQACATIQRRRFRDPLPIKVTRSFRVPNTSTWDLATLSGHAFPSHALGAAVVEVSVDPVTYETRVHDVWLCVDGGLVIDEDGARRTLEMGVYQALEWATHETVLYPNGRVDPRSYVSYRSNARPVLPGVHITLVETSMPEPRGVGTLPYNCVPAALAAAVSQATGRYMDQIPTNPELIHGYWEQE